MTDDLLKLLDRELALCSAEIESFPTDDSIWATRPGITNSAGTLALHVAGNLQHFVGHVLGGSDYVRDRDAEFGSKGLPRADVLEELEAARQAVALALPKLTDDDLRRPYPALPAGLTLTTQLFLMHLTTHAAFHAGQMGYLRRVVTGSNTSNGAFTLRVLSD